MDGSQIEAGPGAKPLVVPLASEPQAPASNPDAKTSVQAPTPVDVPVAEPPGEPTQVASVVETKTNKIERTPQEAYYDKLFKEYLGLAGTSRDKVLPQDDPRLQQYDEALAANDWIDKHVAAGTADEIEYDPKTGKFRDQNKNIDNLARHTRVIVDVMREAVSSGKVESKSYNYGLDSRFKEKNIVGKDGKEVPGYVIDMESVRQDSEILDTSRVLFEQVIRRFTEGKLIRSNHALFGKMLGEYLALLNKQGLPMEVQVKLANDAFILLASDSGGLADRFLNESVTETDNITKITTTRSLRDVGRELSIRNGDYTNNSEAKNPFADFIVQQLIDSNVEFQGKVVTKANAEQITEALFGKNNQLNSWEAMAKLEGAMFAQKAVEDSKLGGILQRLVGVRTGDPVIDALVKNPGLMAGLSRKIFGFEGGINTKVLEALKERFNYDFAKDLGRLEKQGINVQNLGMSLMFVYSIFGPMMGEGEEDDERRQMPG